MKRWWILLLVLALTLRPTASAAADGMQDGKVIFGGNYTLMRGETLNGDLVVFGGNVTVEETAVLNGSLVVMGGNVRSDGAIHGDVVLIGGTLHLGAAALISGDVAVVGGLLEREEGAQVLGQLTESDSIPIEVPGFTTPDVQVSLSTPWWIETIWKLLRAFALAGLAMLAVLFLEKPLGRVRTTAVSQPLPAAGTGLLALVLLPGTLLVLAITLILLPVALVLGLAIAVAVLFGWLALGLETGERLAQAFRVDWSPAVQAAAGMFALALVTDLIGLIPCVGWVPGLLVTTAGLGAVFLTRFGTMAYPASAPAPASPAAAAAALAPVSGNEPSAGGDESAAAEEEIPPAA